MLKAFSLMAFVMTTLVAEDLSGKWVGTIASGSSNGKSAATVYLAIREQGGGIAGTMAYRDETKQVPIEEPQVKGDQLTFEMHDNPNRVVKFRFTASEGMLEGEGTSDDTVVQIKLSRR